MFRYFITVLLIVAFALSSFSKAFIVLDYYANKATFAQNCENKARPQMACGGKCQMMKKLREEQKKDEQAPERKLEHKHEIAISSKSFFAELTVFFLYKRQAYSLMPRANATQMPRSLFHPPDRC